MPFQSEKQRRYMHANLPKIAQRWERDYAHGGILDINEREEIIDDGGNEIELTDYNAAFDDPNDLSTGVKSLFRAKEGGNVRLGPHKATDLLVKKTSTGERPKYQPPGHGEGESKSGKSTDAPPGGGATSIGSGKDYSPPPTRAPDFVTGVGSTKTTTTKSPTGDGRSQALIDISKRPPKYKTVERHVPHTDKIVKTQIRDYYDPKGHQKRAPKNKEEKHILDKIAFLTGVIVTGGALAGVKVPGVVQTANTMLGYRKNINTAFKYGQKIGLFDKKYTVEELFDDQVENYKERKEKMDLYNSLPDGHPEKIALSIELEIGKKPDHLGDDGGSPDLPQVVPIGEEIQEYTSIAPDAGGMLASIRSKQALNARLQAKWAAEQAAHDQLYMVANSGGLANLFRVKKQ